MLERHQTVADVVLDHSETAEVFQRHRIDFCCRGELSLEQAAQSKQVDLDLLVRELNEAIASRAGSPPVELRALSTPQLVERILSNHEGLARAIPFARTLAVKVSRVHGEHNPKLRELKAAVEELEATLVPHLETEARSLAPLLATQPADAAAVRQQLEGMVTEHRTVAALLGRIRAASDSFALPDWACRSYRALFSELEQLETRVFESVYLENHVLRPRFLVT